MVFQRAYQRLKTDVVTQARLEGNHGQSEVDRLGVQRGLAPSDILVEIDRPRIDFTSLRYPPERGPEGYTRAREWYFDGEAVTANTVYFWDVGMEEQTARKSDLHACASRHLTSLMDDDAHFEFYDPNMGELLVPCSEWSNFVESWVLRYTEGRPVVFIDKLSLLPMRRAEPKAEEAIPLLFAEWNSGWFRSRSDASKAAMARLRLLAQGCPASLGDLREAIRWYAGRDADPTGARAVKYGAQPAAGSKLRTLLHSRFATHSFFRA